MKTMPLHPFRVSALLAGALLAVSAHAATYYVSSSDPARTDTGPGSQSQPWATVAKVNASVFVPGDTVYFKCGDQWREKLSVPSSGSSAGRITFTSYGTGAKPVLSGAEVVTGWTLSSTGTANTYYAPLATSTVMVTSDDTFLAKGSGVDTLAANQYRWSAGVLYINIGADPASHLIEAAQRGNAAYIPAGKNYITIRGLSLQKTNLANVLVDNCTYPTVQDCDLFFSNDSSVQAGGGINADRGHYALYKGNHINYSLGDGIMSWRAHDVEISDNYIENVLDGGVYAGADGIQIGAKTTESNACYNFKILNNTVIRPAASTNKGCIIAEMGNNGIIAGNFCSKGLFGIGASGNNMIIENNYVTGFGVAGGIRVSEDMPTDGMKIRYNIVSESSGFAGITLTNDESGHSQPRSNFEIYNNVVYHTYYGISIGQPFSGVIKNNIIWGRHSAPRFRLLVSSVIAGGSVTIDNNIYQDIGTESLLNFAGVAYYDLASWQAASGQDAHSTTANPLWVSPTTGDFHLQTGSPAIDAGASVGLTEDFEGTPVPQGGAPDIGALEYDSATPSEIVIDNTDAGFTTDSAWSASTSTGGYVGSNYLHDGTAGADASTRWAKWTPTVVVAGHYDIYMNWTAGSNRPSAAPLAIAYNGGTDTSKTVNQQTNGATWVLIGNYSLAAGTGNSVKIIATASGYTIADAVRLVYTGP